MNLRVVCFGALLIALIILVDGRTIVRRDAPLKKHLKEQKTLETSLEPHSRQRRGWGSVIFYGTSILIRTTNVGLTLAAIVSDGCVYYQSICDDRDAIEQLDKDIAALKTEYDTEYVKSATDWVNLRDANNNNGYVNYHIDEALQAVQSLDDLQLLLEDKLELKLPNLFARYQANQNLTAEEYLDILVGQLESSLDATFEMLENQKKGEMIGLLVQMLVETTLDRFVTGYKKAYNDLRLYDKMESHYNALWSAVFEADPAEARILSDPTHPDYENALKRHGLKSSQINAFERFKMAPKVFVEMFGNSKKYLADSYNSLKEWGQVESWDGFKAKALSTLETPINKLKAVKNFIFDSNSRKYTVENFKMDWSTRIMTGIGAIVDIVTQAVSVAEWSKVRDEMANARAQYEEYKSALQTEIANIKEEQANQTIEWGNIVDTFKELSSAFDGLIQNASSYADFADVMGLPRLPVDSSNPMFSVDVSTFDQTNLIPAQEAYIEFLKENNNNLTVVNDEMSARNTLYTSVIDKTDLDEVVSEIHTDLGEIYSFNPSATIKQFGTDLSKKDVICTCAILRVDMDEYDHYDLTAFRPSCDVDQSAFTTMEAEAEAARNKVMMDTILYTEVNGGSSATLSELLSTVQTAYSVTGDADKMAFGAALTEQDIACSIATQFTDKDMYDYIDLTAFRPSCDAVTAQNFATMQQDAASLRQLDANVENSMNICDSFSFCPCVSVLASQYSATEAEVQASIKRVRPSLTQYCSTTGCSCVTL